MTITLRPAGAPDAEAVAQVLIESRNALLPFAPMAHPAAEVRTWIATVLIPAGGVHLAICEGQTVGVLALSHQAGQAWIDQLYVRPGHTGQGIGAQLLQLAHRQLQPPIRLCTFQANTGARRFYERHGYRAIALTDGADNEERCPDVLYEWHGATTEEGRMK
ncbi:N-acetyltransferase family protein [Inhella sp.]|uniref:GNAT family N-acetyltransferase n=1 Tax=Inhella sp. TaxID=1921806 RepID=UPI0035B3C95A